MSGGKRKRVVVVGGGFAGRRAHQLLSPHFDVQLVDAKGYYEYTPANLRCMVQPEHSAFTVAELPRGTVVDAVADVVPGGTRPPA
jgi:NADH dehydrogenase FAD-containing subunit